MQDLKDNRWLLLQLDHSAKAFRVQLSKEGRKLVDGRIVRRCAALGCIRPAVQPPRAARSGRARARAHCYLQLRAQPASPASEQQQQQQQQRPALADSSPSCGCCRWGQVADLTSPRPLPTLEPSSSAKRLNILIWRARRLGLPDADVSRAAAPALP
jgi:hypothetical protein